MTKSDSMKYTLALLAILWTSLAAFAQLTDNFDDGDFNNTPEWMGNTDRFQINAGELQLYDLIDPTSPQSSLYLNAATQGTTTWEFYVRMDFNPSSSNYARVYLNADANDFDSDLNGYFVSIGGTSDVVELRRQTGTATSGLITSPDDVTDLSAPAVRVRVTRDASNTWELFLDETGGTNYTSLGTVIDGTHPLGYYFGVRCTYTTTRKDKFFFDDFLIDPLFTDNTPPELQNVDINSSTELVFYFNEPLDPASAANAANFSLDNGAIITSTLIDPANPSAVIITMSAPLMNLTDYTATSTVSDAAGNAANNITFAFTYAVGEAAEPYDVLINEIMADPSPVVGLPDAEFVELFNRSTKVIDLNDYKLASGSTPQLMPEYLLLPGEYVIVCDDSNIADFNSLGITNAVAVSSFNALSNAGDNVTITDLNDQVIHTVDYLDDCYQDENKNDGGWTLELINSDNLCDNTCNNWIACNAVVGGTPGMENSVYSLNEVFPELNNAIIENPNEVLVSFNIDVASAEASDVNNFIVDNAIGNPISTTFIPPFSVLLTFANDFLASVTYTITATGINDCLGINAIDPANNTAQFFVVEDAEPFDLMINEIMADPSPEVGLPSVEFIEIYNRSDKVINIKDYQLSSNTTAQLFPSYIMQAGEYVVVCDDDDVSTFLGLGIDNVTSVESFPSLSNGGDNVTLADAAGIILNAVDYELSWYQNSDKEDGGWTLELINPENPCDISASNWRASNNSLGGTPGQENSVYDESSSGGTVQLLSAEVIDPTQVELTFNVAIDNIAAIDFTNYNIIPNIGNPSGIILSSPSSIIMTFDPVLAGNIDYTVTVSGFNDCSGNNGIDVNMNTADFKLPEPQILSVMAVFPTQEVIVTYDVPMDQASIADINNYSIPSLGTPIFATPTNSSTAELVFSGSFINGETYDLEISNVSNLDGTNIIPTTVSFVYYEPVNVERYDIIINEFMVDPSDRVGLPEVEFVELYNRSDKIISLEGFTLEDGGNTTSSPFPFIVMQPGDYLIVTEAVEDADEFNSYIDYDNKLELENFITLTNAEDDIILYDNDIEVVDALSFDISWYKDSSKDEGGFTLERISPLSVCEDGDNWTVSQDTLGGTPGAVNSIFENTPDQQMPEVFSAFPDSPNMVNVYFSEAIDFELATDHLLYSIDGDIEIASVSPQMPLGYGITILLDTPLQENTIYELTISTGLTDCLGNPFGADSQVRFGLPEIIEEKEIIVNEILFEPNTSGSDFIEIYNNSDKVFNIADLVIYNDAGASTPNKPVENNFLLFPDSYIVLTSNPSNILENYDVENPTLLIKNDLPSLDSGEGNVTLLTINGVIDRVDYYEEYHFALLDDTKGVSLERIDFNAESDDRNNWHSAAETAGFATPTSLNSQWLATTEEETTDAFSLADDTFSPDSDGFEDFLLINYSIPNNGNIANIKIFDAKGRIIRDLVQNELLATEGFYQWDGTNDEGSKARIGIYIVWIEMFDENGNVNIEKETCVLAGQF
jgi:hypothetical protein